MWTNTQHRPLRTTSSEEVVWFHHIANKLVYNKLIQTLKWRTALFEGLSSGLPPCRSSEWTQMCFSFLRTQRKISSCIVCLWSFVMKNQKMRSWVENLFCSQEEIIVVSGRRRQKKKNMFCFGSQSNFLLNQRLKQQKLFSSASKNVCLTNTARLFLPEPSSAHTVHKTWRWLYSPFLKCDCQFCHILSETLPANDNMCS